MSDHAGSCHCGAVTFTYRSDLPLTVRACQCSFCRKHGARSVSDPEGSVMLRARGDVQAYRFGALTADYFVCGACGVYIGAVAEIAGASFATLNLNSFDDPQPQLEATPVTYEGQDPEMKAGRRMNLWTPARIIRD